MAKSTAEFERTAEVIRHWLDTVDLEDSNEFDLEEQCEAMDRLNVLAWGGASDGDMARAVAQARHSGCGWGAIAMALGIPRQRTRDRFSPSTR